MEIFLSGIVGSTAYGLATPESDTDRLGIFASPTHDLLRLRPPPQSHVSHHPDVTYHEAGKYLSLALKANPGVTELLWLDSYEVCTPLGESLISIRRSLLSAKTVRDAYLQYAVSQLKRVKEDGRAQKHARHLLRLLTQGVELYETGHLTVRLEDPERYREFGRAVAAGDLDTATKEITAAERRFGSAESPLPSAADEDAAGRWLQRVRDYYWFWEPGETGVPYGPVPGKPKAVIVDIDGTVAVRDEQQDPRSPYDMSRTGEDHPNTPVIEAVRNEQAAGNLVIFVSARREAARRVTEIWLAVHFGQYEALHMRAEGDDRKDWVIKTELFDKHIRHDYDVLRVYDDRNQTVAGWRRLGLTCFQVAPGKF